VELSVDWLTIHSFGDSVGYVPRLDGPALLEPDFRARDLRAPFSVRQVLTTMPRGGCVSATGTCWATRLPRRLLLVFGFLTPWLFNIREHVWHFDAGPPSVPRPNILRRSSCQLSGGRIAPWLGCNFVLSRKPRRFWSISMTHAHQGKYSTFALVRSCMAVIAWFRIASLLRV
jgi:hypothetical protein